MSQTTRIMLTKTNKQKKKQQQQHQKKRLSLTPNLYTHLTL